MLKMPRKKLVIGAVIVAAVAAITFAAHPVRDAVLFLFLSPVEKKVVGEWQSSSIGGPVVTTIHADHSWTSTGGCLEPPPTIRGTWQIAGTDIVFRFDAAQFGDYGAPEPQRRAIQELIDTDRQTRSWADK